MKIFLVILLLVCTAYAGVLSPTREDIQEAMRLWLQHCTGGKDNGQDGNTFIYCKIGSTPIKEEKKYEINITPSPTGPKQVVFVQSPPRVYRHKLTITGGASPAQQTKIFVLPSRAEHNYSYTDLRSPTETVNKPKLYFLKEDHSDHAEKSGEDEAASETRAPQIQPAASVRQEISASRGIESSNLNRGYKYNPPTNSQYQYQYQSAFKG